MDWVLDRVRAEWDTIVKAPFLLGLLFVLGLVVGWVATRVFYEQDLQTLRDQNAYLQTEIKPAPPTPVAVASPIISQMLAPVTPAESAELESAKSENARLRAENARLKKSRTSRVVKAVSSSPLSCPSVTPMVGPSKLSAEDCNTLMNAQQLADGAVATNHEAVESLVSSPKSANAAAILHTAATANDANQALANVANLRQRFCANP